jgi:hypothetical protein
VGVRRSLEWTLLTQCRSQRQGELRVADCLLLIKPDVFATKLNTKKLPPTGVDDGLVGLKFRRHGAA